MSDVATETAADILRELRGRKGVLDDIDPEIVDEIAATVGSIVRRRLDAEKTLPESVKWMDLNEFVDEGFLQEANRQFFHPHGLALSVTFDDETNRATGITGLWDYRDDPEGILFGEVDGEKVVRVDQERRRHWATRADLFKRPEWNHWAPAQDVQPPYWSPNGETRDQ